MQASHEHQHIPFSFIALMAVLMSFIALSIDAMLPALGHMGRDLQVQNPNDVQLIISVIFAGMALGLIFFGPFSDSFGRKPAIYLGMGIFLFGCLLSIVANSFELMLAGRFLQGVGAASCRISTLCMIRDRFEGNVMARVMSFIMILFILTPALAPALGQLILFFANWRAIFVLMFVLGILSLIWLALGQRETLAVEKRRPFSWQPIGHAAVETIRNPVARGYTLASGIIFGAFIGYLSSSQQILQEQYGLGNRFALAFGVLALSVGFASFANARWVVRFGMENICKRALVTLVLASSLFLPYCLYHAGNPPLAFLMTYLIISFFCFGLLFGNFSTLAIQPLGHIAGTANSVIGSFQTLLSVALGGFIGYRYNGTVTPLILGFFILGICSLLLVFRLSKLHKPVTDSMAH